VIDRVFYINLDRSTDRRVSIERVIAEMGWTEIAERIPGVAWTGPVPTWFGFRNPPAEYGCAMSHTIALRRVVETGATRALILEDDAVIVDKGHLQNLLNNLPEDGDIVHLDHLGRKRGQTYKVDDAGLWWKKDRRTGSTACYVVSAKSAGLLIDRMDPSIPGKVFNKDCPGAADHVLHRCLDLNTYDAKASGLVQAETTFQSTIRNNKYQQPVFGDGNV
jgi:GR25 family glycosyltransferase involved in LPS biosynthesis